MNNQYNRRGFLQAAGAIVGFALVGSLPFAALAQSSAKMKIGTLGSGRVGSAGAHGQDAAGGARGPRRRAGGQGNLRTAPVPER